MPLQDTLCQGIVVGARNVPSPIHLVESSKKLSLPIAIYHCQIKIISRGKGKSAVAAAAYRAAENITNDYDGREQGGRGY